MTTHPSLAPIDAMNAVQRLYFAVLLGPAVGAQAFALGSRLRDDLRIAGRIVSPDRLHVTLHWLGDHPELPVDLVKRSIAAGTAVEAAPFDVVLDRAENLGADGGLVVLMAAQGTAALRRFQRTVGAAMTDAGIGRHVRSSFKPHVSLIYGDRQIERQTFAPIRWTVDELVLIHSVVGESQHNVLGRWPLQARQFDLGW